MPLLDTPFLKYGENRTDNLAVLQPVTFAAEGRGISQGSHIREFRHRTCQVTDGSFYDLLHELTHLTHRDWYDL